MPNESWKTIDDIQRAEEVEGDLWLKLGRRPTRADFGTKGYHVWMALYRYRRKQRELRKHSKIDDACISQVRQEIHSRNRTLTRSLLTDMIDAFGTIEIDNILGEVCKKRQSRWNKSAKKRRPRSNAYSKYQDKLWGRTS